MKHRLDDIVSIDGTSVAAISRRSLERVSQASGMALVGEIAPVFVLVRHEGRISAYDTDGREVDYRIVRTQFPELCSCFEHSLGIRN